MGGQPQRRKQRKPTLLQSFVKLGIQRCLDILIYYFRISTETIGTNVKQVNLITLMVDIYLYGIV